MNSCTALSKKSPKKKADNPIILGKTFSTLKEYHQAKAKTPEAIYQTNAKVYRPQPASTKPAQHTGRPKHRVNELKRKVISMIGPDAYQRRFMGASMLLAVTKIRDCVESMKMMIDSDGRPDLGLREYV